MEREQKRTAKWWRSKWARRLAVLCVGAALGASCSLLPPVLRPACAAVVEVLHTAGAP